MESKCGEDKNNVSQGGREAIVGVRDAEGRGTSRAVNSSSAT